MSKHQKMRKARTSGETKRSIPISLETVEVIEQQKRIFREKFGREPGPEDPIFFDPKASVPQAMSEQESDRMWSDIIEAAGRVGIGPAVIYAMNKTGRIVTEQNRQYLTESDLDEWNEAIEEYYERIELGETQ